MCFSIIIYHVKRHAIGHVMACHKEEDVEEAVSWLPFPELPVSSAASQPHQLGDVASEPGDGLSLALAGTHGLYMSHFPFSLLPSLHSERHKLWLVGMHLESICVSRGCPSSQP